MTAKKTTERPEPLETVRKGESLADYRKRQLDAAKKDSK